jgi:CDP-diacylglycerol--serine O-phosphatidyltransferase
MMNLDKKIVNPDSQRSLNPSMLYFSKDLPNICSLTGLICALLGIYYAISNNFHFALIGILWAVVFDWADGIIARKIKDRTDNQRNFGAQLDSLIDIVSFGVFPAIFLLSYGQFNPWFLPGAFLILAVSAIRLSYFNIFGMIDKKTYKGLALDNNVIILAAIYLLEEFFTHTHFSIILYVVMVLMLVFNLASIHTYKFAGKWFYVLIGYTVVMTVIYR